MCPDRADGGEVGVGMLGADAAVDLGGLGGAGGGGSPSACAEACGRVAACVGGDTCPGIDPGTADGEVLGRCLAACGASEPLGQAIAAAADCQAALSIFRGAAPDAIQGCFPGCDERSGSRARCEALCEHVAGCTQAHCPTERGVPADACVDLCRAGAMGDLLCERQPTCEALPELLADDEPVLAQICFEEAIESPGSPPCERDSSPGTFGLVCHWIAGCVETLCGEPGAEVADYFRSPRCADELPQGAWPMLLCTGESRTCEGIWPLLEPGLINEGIQCAP